MGWLRTYLASRFDSEASRAMWLRETPTRRAYESLILARLLSGQSRRCFCACGGQISSPVLLQRRGDRGDRVEVRWRRSFVIFGAIEKALVDAAIGVYAAVAQEGPVAPDFFDTSGIHFAESYLFATRGPFRHHHT